MREMSIGENYEGNITPHPLRDFEVFERHSGTCVAISHIYKDACSLAQAKRLSNDLELICVYSEGRCAVFRVSLHTPERR